MAEYAGIRIQADEETHEFVGSYASGNIAAGSRVLDIAAGGGALSRRLLDLGFEVHATSWNDKVGVEVPCYNLNLDLPFEAADFGGNRFPLVCAIEIIEHLENPANFLRCLKNIVGQDGKILLSTPNVESAAARLQWLVHGCPRIFDVNEVRKNRHISICWRQGLDYLIELAGLEIVERHFLGEGRMKKGVAAVAKRGIYRVMEYLLAGDLRGSTRLYVLQPSAGDSRSAGPGDVY